MTRHRGITAGIGVLAIVAGLLVGSAPPGWTSSSGEGFGWGFGCPVYSDGAIASLGVREEGSSDFRALLALGRVMTG